MRIFLAIIFLFQSALAGQASSVFPFMVKTKPPVIASYSTYSRNSLATSDVITLPSGIVAGDLLICIVSRVLAGAYWGAGWTELNKSSDITRFRIFYRIATGAESSYHTFSSSNNQRLSASAIIRISGADNYTPIEAYSWSSIVSGATFTASVAAGVMTVTAVASGTIQNGDIISGTTTPAGVTITSFGTGTGGTGTYNLSDSGFSQVSGSSYSIPPSKNTASLSPTTANDLLLTVNLAAGSTSAVDLNTTFDSSLTKVADWSPYAVGSSTFSVATQNILNAQPTGTKTTTLNVGEFNNTNFSIILKAPSAKKHTYATWSRTDIGGPIGFTSDIDTQIYNTIAGTQCGVRSTIGKSSGKWYWESTQNAVAVFNLGVSNSGTVFTNWGSTGNWVAYNPAGVKQGYIGAGPMFNLSYGASYAVEDVVSTLLDMDAGTVTFWKNGVSQGTALTGLTGTYFAAAFINSFTSRRVDTNFGQKPFVYTPPAGYNYGLYN